MTVQTIRWRRELAAALALLMSGAAPLSAQPLSKNLAPPPPQRTPQALTKDPADLYRLGNEPYMLAIDDRDVVVVDPVTLSALRRYQIDITDTLPDAAGRARLPVLLRNTTAGQTIVEPLTGNDLLKLETGEALLRVSDLQRDALAVTFRENNRRLLVRRLGSGEIVASLALPAADVATTPSVQANFSTDATTLGVAWAGHAQLVDMARGTSRQIERPLGSPRIRQVVFASKNSVVLVPNAGPFEVYDARTLAATGRIVVPSVNLRFAVTGHADGALLEIEGRRQRTVFDTKTGKAVVAERMSSGSGYLLRVINRDLVLRAAVPRGGNGSSYGVYRHANGDFKLLYRETTGGLKPGALVASDNAACLFAVTAAGAKIVETTSNRTLFQFGQMPSPVEHAQFAPGGAAIIAADTAGHLLRLQTPTVCHGPAGR